MSCVTANSDVQVWKRRDVARENPATGAGSVLCSFNLLVIVICYKGRNKHKRSACINNRAQRLIVQCAITNSIAGTCYSPKSLGTVGRNISDLACVFVGVDEAEIIATRGSALQVCSEQWLLQ